MDKVQKEGEAGIVENLGHPLTLRVFFLFLQTELKFFSQKHWKALFLKNSFSFFLRNGPWGSRNVDGSFK